jgi:predicted SnoaL-like aldol condensation-catalyzing enzyme
MQLNKTLIIFSSLLLAAATAAAAEYPNKMKGNAEIACNFEADLVFNRKLDLANKYVTDDFVEHNVRAHTTNIKDFQAALAKMPKFNGPAQGCGGAKVVITKGSYVVFLRETMVDDPNAPGKKVTGTHFDVFRFEGDKIAEHWD